MSACVGVFHRDEKPATEAELRHILDDLNYRGPDGSHIWINGRFALGFQHHCVLNEDRGLEWPRFDANRQNAIAFDGRLDNRDELLNRLGLGSDFNTAPDADLALAAYTKWGVDGFQFLIGPFALIIICLKQNRMVLARDPVGNRRLCYTKIGNSFFIASEEQALLNHPEISCEVDQKQVVITLANIHPVDGATYFKGIHTVLPAHSIVIDSDKVSDSRFWSYEHDKTFWKSSKQDVGEAFREILTTAVKSRLRGASECALLLSGGLDSPSILPAIQQAENNTKLTAISTIYEKFSDCDERHLLQLLQQRYRFQQRYLPGDSCGPLADPESDRHRRINDIYIDPLGVRRELYKDAAANGQKIVLSGDCADYLYMAHAYWLRDFLKHNNLSFTNIRNILHILQGSPRQRKNVLRRLMPFNGMISRRRHLPEWITEQWHEILKTQLKKSYISDERYEQDRFECFFNLSRTRLTSAVYADAGYWGCDLRNPYMDRRLVCFILNLPAYYAYDPQTRYFKALPRLAFEGILPEQILKNPTKTNLNSLFIHGLREQQAEHITCLLQRRQTVWPDYVKSDAVTRWLVDLEVETFKPLWYCVCLELWADALKSKNI